MTNSRSMVRAVLGALTIILCSLVVPPVAQAVQIRRDRPPLVFLRGGYHSVGPG